MPTLNSDYILQWTHPGITIDWQIRGIDVLWDTYDHHWTWVRIRSTRGLLHAGPGRLSNPYSVCKPKLEALAVVVKATGYSYLLSTTPCPF